MKARIFSLVSLLLFLFLTRIHGQTGVEDGSRYGHGEDSIRCVTNLSLYREYARQRDYKSAVRYWRIVFRECPQSTKNIYIDGVRIFKYFVEMEKNNEIRSQYVDTLMTIYNQRIKYYPADKGDQRGRQGVDLLRYMRNEGIKYIRQAYDYLLESINIEKNDASLAVLATFFTSAITLFQNNEIDEDKLIDDYLLSNSILEAKSKKSPGDRTIEEVKEAQDKNMQSINLSCDKLTAKFSKLFDEDQQNNSNLKTIVEILKAMNCEDKPLFLKAAINLQEQEPTAELAALIAYQLFDKGEYARSGEYFKQAIQLENNNEIKATFYLGLAKCQYKLNKKPGAREDALKAAELKPNWGEPYLIIGQMYAESVDDCSDLCLPKAVYWAAADMFNKAKSVDPSVVDQANKFIVTYSGYFPNKENAFFCGVNEGDTYTIKCWINETTKARF